MKRLSGTILIVAAVIALTGISVDAQPGKIQIGKLKVLPSLAVEEVYDDNIFLGNGDNDTTELEDNDFITHLKPELMVGYDINGRGSISAGVSGDLAFYADYTDNDWQTFRAMLDADYETPVGLFMGLSNTYANAEDPSGGINEYNLGQITKRWNNDLRTHIGYNFGDQYKVTGFLNYYKQDYDDEEDFTQDWEDFEVGLGVSWRVMPKTWLFGRYHYGSRDFTSHRFGSTDDNDADFDWSRVNVGLQWDATAKLDGEVNFGYQWIDHDNDTDLLGAEYDDPDAFIAATLVNYTLSPRTRIAMRLYRAVRYTGSLTRENYEDTGIGVNVMQRILNKLILKAEMGYSYMDYNTNDRNDDNFNLGLGLDYEIQDWLVTGVMYSFKTKDSSSDAVFDDFGDANDYDDNQFKIYLKASY